MYRSQIVHLNLRQPQLMETDFNQVGFCVTIKILQTCPITRCCQRRWHEKKDDCKLLGNIIIRTLPQVDRDTIPRTIQHGFTPVLRPGGLATDNPTHNSFDNAVILLGSECVHQHFHSREKQRKEQFTPSNTCRRLVLWVHWPINRNLYCHRLEVRSHHQP